MTHMLDPLSLATIRRIDEICDQFEQSCRSGKPADLPSLLATWDGPERSALLDELVAVDLHYADLLSVRREPGDYLARLPDDGPAIELAFRQASGAPHNSTFYEPGIDADSTVPLDDAARSPDAALAQCIGRYEILRELGSGAFGIVYLAHDPELNRNVAIKCPKTGVWKAESQWEMLRREAELAAKLRHPGVVAIHDVGHDESRGPYFVMDYICGESLKDRLVRDRIDAREVMQLALALATALDSIHQAGLVHRDLKPANVLLDESGQSHIADLGLALDAHGTATEELAGTFAYMAPEQAPAERTAGDRPAVDHRCDIWAVGVILYEMLVGRRPFAGGSRGELFRQILHETPRPPSSMDPRVHPSVSQICMTCLAKDRHARYASAGALADALRQAQLSSFQTWTRRRVAALSVCLLAVLASVVAVRRVIAPRVSAPTRMALATVGAETSEAPAPSERPFVIRGGERFADLHAAVDAAADGAIIEIDGDGPIAVDQVKVPQHTLTIRAARGRRPVLTLADETRLCMLHTSGRLLLEGLDLRREMPSSQAIRNPPSVVFAEAPGSLLFKRCRIVATSSSGSRAPCILVVAGDCLVQDTELHHDNGGGVMWVPAEGGRLSLENCVTAVANLVILKGDRRTRATAEVVRSSVSAQQAFLALGMNRSPSDARLLLRAERCFFDVDAVLRQVVPFSGGASQPLDAVANSFSWQGTQNVFAVRDTFVRSTFGGRSMSLHVDDLTAWNELWGTESGSVEIAATEDLAVSKSFDDSIPMKTRLDWSTRVADLQVGFVAGAHVDGVGPEARFAIR